MWALQCGCASRREFYHRLTMAELRELEVAYATEPWGEYRADLRNGIATANIVAASGNLRRGQRVAPRDFMPFLKASQKAQDPVAMKAAVKSALAGGFGIKRKAEDSGNGSR